ncbi:MAG: hypothetical protein IKF78_13085 [Atopobiaceae bacterium]|nr:hypothetical protein [Atopobiaceae bacterium]
MPTSLSKYLDPTGLDETVVNIRQLAEALEAEMQELPYARPDGLYPDMTVGAVIGADETAQWATRESTGSGSAIVRSVQGAAVAWEQMCPAMSDSSWALITAQTVTKTVTDEVMTLTFNGNGSSAGVRSNKGPDVISGHKYYIAYDVCENTTGRPTLVNINGSEAWAVTASAADTAGSEWVRVSGMFTIATDSQFHYVCLYMNGVTSGSVKFRNVICADLTQMFGSGNEPSTVSEFEALYPEPYYPYSAPVLKPVQIAGIRSTDAQGGELDSVEWDTFTLRGAGSIGDMLYSDRKETKVGVVDLGTFAWARAAETSGHPYFYSSFYGLPAPAVQPAASLPNATCAIYQRATFADLYNNYANVPDGSIGLTNGSADNNSVYIKDDEVTDVTALRTKLSGVLLFYELATPTTQPISPALPMTYKVQQGGSESVIVPDGEVSAAPVLTIAEPVNMSTELTRIWEAIQSLGYTRNTAQLSRPVSLTDTVSVDETQKDTTDVVEIDTTKEVQE